MSTLRFNTWQNTGGTDVANSTLGTGKILQVAYAQTASAFSTTSTSYVDVDGLSVSITPRSASSTILLMFAASASALSSNQLVDFQLDRNGTAIPGGGTYDALINAQFIANVGWEIKYPAVNYVDSPATTSALTYKIQVKTSSGTAYLFRRSDTDVVTSYGSLIAMEVSA